MLFHSLHFVIFLPVVVCLHFLLPQRWRWAILLAASYYFYMCWKPEYAILLVVFTMVNYCCGLAMGAPGSRRGRAVFLTISILSDLSILFFFKYYGFASSVLEDAFRQFNLFYDFPAFDYLLPVGISFYTFQTMAYSIDVYRGIQTPERHLGRFALYVTFFPQLVAGPIERPRNLLPQFRQERPFRYEQAVSGLQLVLWGMVKKVVIADRLAAMANQVYNNPGAYDGLPLLLGTYAFAFQIYCDFSAYSDIARGAARMMGYELMVNFRQPYLSQSIREFWARWHISLSTWFRDYVYIPLGGNRVSKPRWYLNLGVVFVISGMWHGANWTFLIWGAVHGTYLVVAIVTQGFRERVSRIVGLDKAPGLQRAWRMFVTFHLVCLSWVLFRANSLHDVGVIFSHMASLDLSGFDLFSLGLRRFEFGVTVLMLVVLGVVDGLWSRGVNVREIMGGHRVLRWQVYMAGIFAIVFLGVMDRIDFIYFQF